MRKTNLLPMFLRDIVIRGSEDETPEQKLAREKAEAESGDDNDDEDEDGSDKDKAGSDDNAGLKSALQKERLERKKLAKQLKDLTKFKEEAESKDKSETDKAKDNAAKATSQTTKLADALKKNVVDTAIIKMGTQLKFRDIDDALALVNRELIEVDQDEDEPSDITLDETTVKSALEKLAKSKPHLVVAEGQEEKSASKFNGGSKKSTKDADEELLRLQYPALRRSGHTS